MPTLSEIGQSMRRITRNLVLLAGLAIPLWVQPPTGRIEADFQRRLKQEENCTWQELGKRFSAPKYLEKLPFDRTSASSPKSFLARSELRKPGKRCSKT